MIVSSTGIIVAIVTVSGALLLLLICIIRCIIIKKRRHKNTAPNYFNKRVVDDIRNAVDTFEVPFKLREVKEQTPGQVIQPKISISYHYKTPPVTFATKDINMRQNDAYCDMINHLKRQRKLDSRFEDIEKFLFSKEDSEYPVNSYGDRSHVTFATEEELFDIKSTSKKGIGLTSEGLRGNKTYRKSGRIVFTTEYHPSNKTLEVFIIKAINLASKIPSSELNIFINIQLQNGKGQKFDTTCVSGTCHPVINQTLIFKDIETTQLDKYKLHFKVYHYLTIFTNELIGEFELPLSKMNINIKEQFNADIFLAKKTDPGCILVSLCHQATFSRLEVIIQEIKNLHKTPSKLNPYLVAMLFGENGLIRKETNMKYSKKLKFNEALMLPVYTNVSTPLEIYSLAITINNRNAIGKDEVLGYVLFSSKSPQQTASDQWRKIIQEPHKQYSEWHLLLDKNDLYT